MGGKDRLAIGAPVITKAMKEILPEAAIKLKTEKKKKMIHYQGNPLAY